MGLRFRKSVKLGKNTRLNIGKKSIGISTGVKGARTSINSSGRRTSSVGIPGTGISYVSTNSGKTKKKKSSSKGASQSQSATKGGCIIGVIIILIISALIVFVKQTITGKQIKSLEWQRSSATITDQEYTHTIRLSVKGDYDADELDPDKFIISCSDNSVCEIQYMNANYSAIEFNVRPLKNGIAKVTASYEDIKSGPIELTIKIKADDKSSEKPGATAKPAETKLSQEKATKITTVATTQAEESIVYITPNGDKYHNKSCRYYSDDCTAMKEKDAKQAGHTACQICGG